MAGTAWRRAAALIMSGRAAPDEPAVLMLRRSGTSRHLPDVEVFPGGLVEEVDFSGEWRPFLSVLPLGPLLLDADRPATFLERPAVGDELPAELGFRLAALRETFEETGVLLVRPLEAPHRPQVLPAPLASQWRPRVHEQPSALLELARRLALVPDVWSLHEWSAWLTPVGMSKRRHDAAFFVASLPERPACSSDGVESATVEWRRPADVLADQAAGRTFLMPPQMYELSRLQRFASWTVLERFSRQRAARGLSRTFPVSAVCSDGHLLRLLNGDDLYPASPDLLAERPTPLQLHYTLEEAVSGTRRWHRAVAAKHHPAVTHCNIELPYGHVAPVAYPALQPDIIPGGAAPEVAHL